MDFLIFILYYQECLTFHTAQVIFFSVMSICAWLSVKCLSTSFLCSFHTQWSIRGTFFVFKEAPVEGSWWWFIVLIFCTSRSWPIHFYLFLCVRVLMKFCSYLFFSDLLLRVVSSVGKVPRKRVKLRIFLLTRINFFHRI